MRTSRELLSLFLEDVDAQEADALEDALVDAGTQLPTLYLSLRRLQQAVASGREIGIITIQINPFVGVEELFGPEVLTDVMGTLANALRGMKTEILRGDDVLVDLSISGNSFVLALSPPRYQASLNREDVERLKGRVGEHLNQRMAELLPAAVRSQLELLVGTAIVHGRDSALDRRTLFRAIDSAHADAHQARQRELQRRATELERAIVDEQLRVVFQPIIDLDSGRPTGHEMLLRVPASCADGVEEALQVAYSGNLLWKLERAVRGMATRALEQLPSGQLLFVNTDPGSILDPELRQWSENRGVRERVVLEITERARIGDYTTFRQILNEFGDVGLRVAVDDVGSAYSGLRMIAEVRPSFIKLDMNLTRGIDVDALKRELVTVVVEFCRRAEIPLVIEGVETPEELGVVRRLGVRYAQGYLFARPAATFVTKSFKFTSP